jgi:hypothetical protein
VTGFAFNERSLALYRDWELVEVLATTVANAQDAAPDLRAAAERLAPLVQAGRRGEAVELLRGLPALENTSLATIISDLIDVLS